MGDGTQLKTKINKNTILLCERHFIFEVIFNVSIGLLILREFIVDISYTIYMSSIKVYQLLTVYDSFSDAKRMSLATSAVPTEKPWEGARVSASHKHD